MVPNPHPELSGSRQPVLLPDDGAPPEGRPIIIPGEDDLDPAVREQWDYEAAKRRVKQMPWAILRYGLPNVIVGLFLIKAGWDFSHSGLQGTGSLAFAFVVTGLSTSSFPVSSLEVSRSPAASDRIWHSVS